MSPEISPPDELSVAVSHRTDILIAEDDLVSRRILEAFLVRWGYCVTQVSSGDDAWRILNEEGAPRLAILDWMMPGLNGVELCARVRSRTGSPYVYLLLLSSRNEKKDKLEGLQAGADDYLTKPFDFSELLARVRALGRRGSTPLLKELNIADLRIDPGTRKVTRAGQAIQLTPKEYQLLEVLMRHAGQVVTRTELLESVWELHFDPGSNIVDVVIKILRDKIDRKFAPRLIQTVRGAGYMIKAEDQESEELT